MLDLSSVGRDWAIEEIDQLTEELERITPSEYIEANRYLPSSVTSQPGYLRFSVNPFMREIIDCFDVNSPVQQVSVKKGVQITYSTLLESGLLYYADYIGTLPIMYMTADKELAQARIENNFIPMFQQSDKSHVLKSTDEGNNRKSAVTKNHMQFTKGGYMVPFGAKNADKMRQFSIAIMLKDEIDAWPDIVGKDGDPDKLSDDRTVGFKENCKIFRGSTPLNAATSKIQKNYLLGDRRQYYVRCKSCNFPQVLRWLDKEGEKGGFYWELEDGILVPESVSYKCRECGHAHYDHDKEQLYSEEHGAEWIPSAKPYKPNVRSYHLPGLYSPAGFLPWWEIAADYLEAWDTENRQVKDIGKYQRFYNNILAEPFEEFGSKVSFVAVSSHRRSSYNQGSVPNKYAIEHSGSPILFVTCQIDVQKEYLSVATMGWTKDACCYLIEYMEFEDKDCSEVSSPVWGRLRDFLQDTIYEADDGRKYNIALTLIDSGYSNPTIVSFCAEYAYGVYPILGRPRPDKNQTIAEFGEFQTKQGTTGFKITVDHYKDRMAGVLRREWQPDAGKQKPYHFNTYIELSDKALKELTVETRRKKTDARGRVSYEWHRPGGARNELWDLLGYGYAAVEILAWSVCIREFEADTVDWARFWEYIEKEKVYFTEPKALK